MDSMITGALEGSGTPRRTFQPGPAIDRTGETRRERIGRLRRRGDRDDLRAGLAPCSAGGVMQGGGRGDEIERPAVAFADGRVRLARDDGADPGGVANVIARAEWRPGHKSSLA